MNDKNKRIMFSITGNLEVNIPIFFALFGFLAAIVILDVKGCKSDAVYHDLYLTNKDELALRIIDKRISFLNERRDSLLAIAKRNNPAAKPAKLTKPAPPAKPANDAAGDTTEQAKDGKKAAAGAGLKPDSLSLIDAAIAAAKKEINDIKYNNGDIPPKFYLNYFTMHRDTLYRYLNDEDNKGCEMLSHGIAVNAKNMPGTSDEKWDQSLTLTVGKGEKLGLVSFFQKYPNFGLWFILSIAQMIMWFLMIPIAVGAVKKTDKIVPELPFNWRNGFLLSLIPIATIALFVWLLYARLIDKYIITDCYFLDGFANRMFFYSFPGYLVATLCFGMYLFLANKLAILNKSDRVYTMKEDTDLQEEYKSLRAAFDMTFLISAIILSAFVLWTSILFNSLNSLEAFSFYAQLSGRPFFDYNQVYLLGLIHSLILLIFYVPVRIQFNNLILTAQQKEIDMANAEGGGGPKKIFKTFWEGITTVLLTASPLITGLLEKLISSWLS